MVVSGQKFFDKQDDELCPPVRLRLGMDAYCLGAHRPVLRLANLGDVRVIKPLKDHDSNIPISRRQASCFNKALDDSHQVLLRYA